MKRDKKPAIGFLLAGLFISGLMPATTSTVVAQNEPPTKSTTVKRSSGGRDPFRRYEPPRQVVKKISGQVLPPTIQERIESYKAQKLAAMNARMPAPKPTTALLLSEIQVIGISRTPRGYAAMVEAMPIKLTYVIYPGEPFYDGQLVAIEDTRLVFRHETVFTDGRRERAVQLKNLRQPNTVNAMSTTGTTTSVAAAQP
ncbi:MAG TPA: hypothetical protein VF074_02455 [Pyrinomonadaceae bacterium]